MNTLERKSVAHCVELEALVDAISGVLMGKNPQIRLALACILARGHLLIEDMPGMGKTTLAHAIADVLGLSYKRVQFTSDLLPSDLLGVSIFNPQHAAFEFHKGPVFTQLLLADEINRSSAKTQSALLEAMEENQVSSEGVTRLLPNPFFVIATQNPSNHSGTYVLPESQLDRFLMRIELGYPSWRAEREMLQRESNIKGGRAALPALLTIEQLKALQAQAEKVKVSEHILDYLQRLIKFTREDSALSVGASPRGSLALLAASKAWALLSGRDYVLPEDIQQVFSAVIGHRLICKTAKQGGVALAAYVLANVDVLYA